MNDHPILKSNRIKIDWPSMIEINRRWLSTVIYARVRDTTAVDDVMQEVSIAAIDCRQQLSGNDAIARWLYRVAVRQALLYRRKSGREQNKLTRYYTAQCEPAGMADQIDPLKIIEQLEEKQNVRRALSQLCPKDREVLLLKYVEDWSCRQLSERLGTSEGSVKARLLRARKRLRQRFLELDACDPTQKKE